MATETALVTGAAGFLGRPLCALLREAGWRVRAVDRVEASGPWDELVCRDLTDPAAVAGLCDGVHTVFHLAAKTHAVARHPDEEADYRRLNVELTRSLVEAAVAAGVAGIVFMSSVKVLGEGGPGCVAETAPPQPASPYGRTKLAAEGLVHAAGADHGLHTCVLRAPLMYGPGVKGNLAQMLAAVARGVFPPLPETGNRRSLVDVRDVARALVLVAREPAAAGRTWTVTDGRIYSTRGIVDLMRAALGKGPLRWAPPLGWYRAAAGLGGALRRVGVPFPLDDSAFAKLFGSAEYESAGLRDELGFSPRHTLDRALPDMIA